MQNATCLATYCMYIAYIASQHHTVHQSPQMQCKKSRTSNILFLLRENLFYIFTPTSFVVYHFET